MSRSSPQGVSADQMRVSVVIPVFNHALWLKDAVTSALAQSEVDEILLIEDGSSDHSLERCEELASTDPRVVLLRHPNGENRGAGASRNLGIRRATGPLVAFLDADDLMLPKRFQRTIGVLSEFPDTDGVYEAVGYRFDSRDALRLHMSDGRELLTTMSRVVEPDRLFWEQSPVGDAGYCNTDGWTFRRDFLMQKLLFNEHLGLHEDTDFFIRASIAGVMRPGELSQPVATRRLHAANRISSPRSEGDRFETFQAMWIASAIWALRSGHGQHGRHLALLAFRGWLSGPLALGGYRRRLLSAVRLLRGELSEFGPSLVPRILAKHFLEIASLPFVGLFRRLVMRAGAAPSIS